MEVEKVVPEPANTSEASQDTPNEPTKDGWSFEALASNPVGMRGGGCAKSILCDHDNSPATTDKQDIASTVPEIQLAEPADIVSSTREGTPARHASWPGWAELENDPEIFTILLQEWGMRNVQVTEVYDITDLLDLSPSLIFGLIFLSRYAAPSENNEEVRSKESPPVNEQPWFANQISKFSCGTVALMNILMNIGNADINLSETMSSFKSSTSEMNAKHRGMALDSHTHFRDIHNSFSTKLDQYIVDVMLKEEANKAKRRDQALNATKKRKRGGARFTKPRKRKQTYEEDEENGFHFVAYVSAHNNVWKMDGMQAAPTHVGKIEEGQTWLNVTVQDVLPLLKEALSADQQCTMMSVTKLEGSNTTLSADKSRKQEDWAPFIETLIRIHAERGDLNEMLRL